MRPGVLAAVPGLFSLEEQPGSYATRGCASHHSAAWPQPWSGEALDDPNPEWAIPGKGAPELTEVTP